MTDTFAVAGRYVDALNAGDFATVASMFADDVREHLNRITWMPGRDGAGEAERPAVNR